MLKWHVPNITYANYCRERSCSDVANGHVGGRGVLAHRLWSCDFYQSGERPVRCNTWEMTLIHPLCRLISISSLAVADFTVLVPLAGCILACISKMQGSDSIDKKLHRNGIQSFIFNSKCRCHFMPFFRLNRPLCWRNIVLLSSCQSWLCTIFSQPASAFFLKPVK